MVGGLGSRLRPLTNHVPKPLLRIGGQTIVQRILGQFAAAGIIDIVLTINYMAEHFTAFLGDGSSSGVQIRYIREDTPLGTAGALTMLPDEFAGRPMIVTNGDLITDIDFAAFFAHHQTSGVSITVGSATYEVPNPYGVLTHHDGLLTSIVEKPTRVDAINAGMYVVDHDLVQMIPAGRMYGMPNLIDAVMAAGRPVGVYPLPGYWYDVGTPQEFDKVSELFSADKTGE